MAGGQKSNAGRLETISRPSTCNRRHRSTSSSSRVGSRDNQEHPSHAFVLKCAKEQEKLRLSIAKKLREDLNNLFECEIFSDFVVECDSTLKKCHSCVFVKRVPNLYKELFNNFKVLDGESCANNSTFHVRIPLIINSADFLTFLRKIYCDDDIRKDEVDLIRRLKNWTMDNSTQSVGSSNGCDVKNSNDDKEVSETEIFNLSEDDFEVGKSDEKESTNKLNDSLEIMRSNNLSNSLMNSDSLTNISLNNDEKANEDESSFISGGNSFDSGDEANGPEVCGSSSSSQMVRSGTFDLLCQMPLEDAIEKNGCKLEESIEKPKTLNLNGQSLNGNNVDSLERDRRSSGQNDDESSFNDLDADTPVADLTQSISTKSPGAMFQFFIDVEKLPQTNTQQEIRKERSSASSGFMFIDINSCDNDFKNNGESSTLRSYSAPFVESKSEKGPSISPGRSSRSATKQSFPEKKVNNNVVEAVQNEEIPLLPMSPIPRRKRLNQETLPRKKEKPVDIKPTNFRHSHNGESNHLMSSSWKSDGGKSEANVHSRRSSASRQRNYSPSVQDDESIYSEVSSLSSSLARDRQNVNHDSLDDQNSLLSRTLESCSKLGEDLLQMFFDEINCDVIIEAEDKEIKAHKCILVSRSPYFAAMFTGEWIESQANKINLKGFSFNSVHFALCHIYSGTVVIPRDNLNLAELALLSDLLSLDTLKEIVLYELKKNYCHFFHKPCHECIIGVIDCLTLSSQCGLETLYHRCLSWIGKHFLNVWPTKTFASLQPPSLIDACYRSTVNHMTPENSLEFILNCERLATSLPRVKWAEQIFSLIGKLMEDSCNFVATNYDLVVASNAFISLGKGRSWNISTLENTLLAAMNSLTPDVACKTLIQLSNILMISETETAFGYGPYVDSYVSLVKKMYRHCERYLIHNAGAVANCESWSLISPEVQQHIKDSAVIVFEFEKPIAPRPKLSSVNRQSSKQKPKTSSEIEEKKDTKGMRRSPKDRSSSNGCKHKNDNHIYDEVPVECGDSSGETFIPYKDMKEAHATNMRSDTNAVTTKKSQVAKVSPFTVNLSKSESSSSANPASSASDSKADTLCDLVAEIDAESNLVNNCLQEAELLEKELTRKLAKQSTPNRHSRTRTHLRTNSHDLGSARNQMHPKRPSSGSSKPGSARPPFK